MFKQGRRWGTLPLADTPSFFAALYPHPSAYSPYISTPMHLRISISLHLPTFAFKKLPVQTLTFRQLSVSSTSLQALLPLVYLTAVCSISVV